MNDYLDEVKEALLSLIQEISLCAESYVKRPGKDFTRKRKLSFEDVLKLLISMGGNSIYKELLDFQGHDSDCVTTSAFVQQRDKILPTAFEELFRTFTASHSCEGNFKGYRLLAADGTDLKIATNQNDHDTFFSTDPVKKGITFYT